MQDGEWCIGWQNNGVQMKDGREITLLGGMPIFVRQEVK